MTHSGMQIAYAGMPLTGGATTGVMISTDAPQ